LIDWFNGSLQFCPRCVCPYSSHSLPLHCILFKFSIGIK